MNFPLQNGQLPVGFCPPDYQTLLNGFTAQQSVNLNILSSLVVSSTPPSDHTVAWLQLDSAGNPVRIYFFANGAWLSLHPLVPGFTMIWNQVLPNFQTFDGGDAVVAPYSPISGQMWQLAASTLDGLGTQVLAAQFPIGVGTLPSTTPVALAGTGGEEVHKLVTTELAPHTHGVTSASGGLTVRSANGNNLGAVGSVPMISDLSIGGTNQNPLSTTSTGGDPSTIVGTNPPTAALGHNTLPPFYGVYFLQRTKRLFYKV